MKKILCLLFILITPLLFCGCGNAQTNYVEESMFIVIEYLNINQSNFIYILVHKETKVMYMTQYNGGLTVMLNADGTPMLWEGELE